MKKGLPNPTISFAPYAGTQASNFKLGKMAPRKQANVLFVKE